MTRCRGDRATHAPDTSSGGTLTMCGRRRDSGVYVARYRMDVNCQACATSKKRNEAGKNYGAKDGDA